MPGHTYYCDELNPINFEENTFFPLNTLLSLSLLQPRQRSMDKLACLLIRTWLTPPTDILDKCFISDKKYTPQQTVQHDQRQQRPDRPAAVPRTTSR